MSERTRVAVLISGRGSNMTALLDSKLVTAVADIVAVVSNAPSAPGLALARARGVETRAVDHQQFPTRAAFETALDEVLEAFQPDLLVLAGFMRILTPAFTTRWHGRMLNIHPSLLPAYPGLNTHARVLADGARCHGATVHFVTGELDGGPAILQARVPVHADDNEAMLASRVLAGEHQILPLVTSWFATGRLRLHANAAELDGQPLTAPLQFPRDVDSGRQHVG